MFVWKNVVRGNSFDLDANIGLKGRRQVDLDGKIGLEDRQKGRQGWNVGPGRKARRPESAESSQASNGNLIIDITFWHFDIRTFEHVVG